MKHSSAKLASQLNLNMVKFQTRAVSLPSRLLEASWMDGNGGDLGGCNED